MKKLLLLILLVFVSHSYGQEYNKMIIEGNHSFKKIQESANQHFKIKGTGKGTGYKQFKRWEYNAQRMLDDKGFVKKSSFYIEELKAYNRTLNNKSSNAVSTTANWNQIGPTSVTVTSGWNHGIGRITGLAIESSNVNHMIVGARTGGIWKTTDKGTTWTSLSDNFSNMVVYSVAMHPTDNKTYYWGSGSKIYTSTNSGSTWAELSTFNFVNVNKIIINPNNPQIMFATDIWGIYKSTDAGVNWTQVVTADANGLDVEFKPGDFNTIYATGGQFHKSTDSGATWTSTATGFGTGKKLIGVSPADVNTVYVLEENSGVFGGFYVSSDSGATFTKKDHGTKNYFGYEPDASDKAGQAPRDMAIAVSPTNINEVHIAGIISFRSLDAGTTFTATSMWGSDSTLGYCHADIDDMVYFGTDLFVISDGGIYVAANPAGTIDTNFYVNKTNGMGIHQFYKIGISQTTPAIISGGTQDNGTNVLIGGAWKHWLGGDGMESFVDKNDNTILYGTTQNGGLSRFDNKNSGPNITSPESEGNWVTPFEQDPTVANTIYAGFKFVYKSTDKGVNWTAISQDFTILLNQLKISQSDNRVMYASEGSNLYKTTTGSGTWAKLTGFSAEHINSIAIHPTNPNKIAIATANTDKVQVSVDGGATWVVKKTGLPNFDALALVWQNNNKDGLYVGMNYGIYYIDNTLTSWQNFSNLLPNVQINELEINTVEGKLYAGTYGRGAWSSNLYGVTLSVEENILANSVNVFPNPAITTIQIQLSKSLKGEIRLFTSSGQLIHYEKANELINKTIDVSNLSSGIYFLRLNLEGGIVTKKIIKQ